MPEIESIEFSKWNASARNMSIPKSSFHLHFKCVCFFYHWAKHNICEIVYCAHIFHTFHLDLSSRALVHQRSCSRMMIIARAILPLFHFYWNFTWFSQNCIRIEIFLENYRKKKFLFCYLKFNHDIEAVI